MADWHKIKLLIISFKCITKMIIQSKQNKFWQNLIKQNKLITYLSIWTRWQLSKHLCSH